MWLVVVGILAGLTTTVAGMGGGLLLLVALAAVWGDPVRALAVATPALLVGSLHRAALFRRSLDVRRTGPWLAMSLCGAVLGGLAVLGVPPAVVHGLLVGSALVAAARQLGVKVGVPARWLAPVGLGVGLLSSAGGAGLLAGPVLQAAGFVGDRYVANFAATGVALSVGRLVAFEAGGALSPAVLADAGWLALGMPLGNWLGRGLRDGLTAETQGRIEVGATVILVAGSVFGLA